MPTSTDTTSIPASAAEIPDVPVLQAIGDRRTIRYYDPDKKVEEWKLQAVLQAARLSSCQGNINATEAIVVQRETCELWDDIEECVSGFNVQMINQSSHLVFWLTNLNAWYGRANDGLSTLALSGALTKYHGWNYEFSMTQTIPRLMSFPTERTDQLLRFETGLAVSQAMMCANSLGLAQSLIAFGRKPGGVEAVFGLPPHYKFTWAHVLGYPLEDRKAGGQRPRIKFEKLFHKGAFGTPYVPDPEVDALLREKGMIQEQAPLPGRMEELDALAERFGREPGCVSWPDREIRRLMNDEDWDFGPRIRAHAQSIIDKGGLPDYPEAMREVFTKLMEEHGLDTSKYLS
ncbi:MAG: nitroreductase family protein [Thermoleophilia bacterium]|nr:nitroreductase family protein [Thermoleophilia bacterium]